MIQAFQTETFERGIRGLDGKFQKIAEKLRDEIIEDPLRNSLVMKADYRGLRRRGKGPIRILYAYCKDCRQRSDEIERGCPDCKDYPDEAVKFYYVGHRSSIY
jgi:mRNA-degrading endonuclease RelE of RelBE toxin-antitoxin system